MLVRSISCSLVALAGLAAAPAVAQNTAQSSSQASSQPDVQSASKPSAQPTEHARAVPLHEMMRGEWDGQVQVTASGKTSAGYASLSVRPRDGRLVLAFEGVANKHLVEGVASLRIQDDAASAVLASSILAEPAHMSRRADAETGVLRLSTVADAKGRIEQVVRMPDANTLRIEIDRVHADGRRERLAHLDMTRLPAGEVATAAAMLRDDEKMRPVMSDRAHASVPAQGE
jgi:hypothetical protein